MANWFIKRIFSASVVQLYLENRLWALLHLVYDSETGVLRTNKLTFAYCVCANLILTLLFPIFVFLEAPTHVAFKTPSIDVLLGISNLFLNYFSTIVTVTTSLKNQKEILLVLNDCLDLMRLFAQTNFVDSTKYARKSLVSSTVKYSVVALLVANNWAGYLSRPIYMFFLQSYWFIFFIVLSNIYHYVLSVSYLVESLASRIQHLDGQCRQQGMVHNAQQVLCDELEEITSLYIRISARFESFINIYSIQLTTAFGMLFFNTLVNVSGMN
jgi:7tm Chemosensory receptor